MNVVALIGRLTVDPELKHTGSDVPVTSFNIAVDRRYQKQGENRVADFITIVAWRQTAEFICKHFTKGQMIAVAGSITTRSYEDREGKKRTAVEVVADNVSFCGSKSDSKPHPSNDDFGSLLDDSDLPF